MKQDLIDEAEAELDMMMADGCSEEAYMEQIEIIAKLKRETFIEEQE